MKENKIDSIITIIKKINQSIDTLEIDTDLFAEGIIDSFGIINLICDIEQEFSIHVSTEEMTMSNFSTPHSIAKLIESKQVCLTELPI